MNIKKTLGIIPARYQSTRFRGKPLARIGAKSMIQRVYEQSAKALPHVIVATDDERIEKEVVSFGGKVVMTRLDHQSGTDRCAEAAKIFSDTQGHSFDIIVNIQGDEPFIDPDEIKKLVKIFARPGADIGTLVKKIDHDEDLFNPNVVKVVLDKDRRAMYFSRSPIPYVRNKPKEEWLPSYGFLKHLGIYAYRANTLAQLTRLPQSGLELAESLEQNRWLENGYQIFTDIAIHESMAVDTPGDLQEIINKL